MPRGQDQLQQQLQAKVASQVEHFREIIRQRDSEICNLLADEPTQQAQQPSGDGEAEPRPWGLRGHRRAGDRRAGDRGDAASAAEALRGFYVQL